MQKKIARRPHSRTNDGIILNGLSLKGCFDNETQLDGLKCFHFIENGSQPQYCVSFQTNNAENDNSLEGTGKTHTHGHYEGY